MLVYAHRANLNGPAPETENSPAAISRALAEGYHVEVDAWFDGYTLRLGHDVGVYPVDLKFLEQEGILVHCKNPEALILMHGTPIHYFWHQDDAYTLSSKGELLINPKSAPIYAGVYLMPELSSYPIELIELCAGVVTDHPAEYL
jgi:hypothetical protein